MSTAPDQSLSDAASSLGRSSSIDARDGALPRSDSQRRLASKMGRKGGRSSNDLFVCFAPRTTLNLVSANRPVVSPARDKGKEPGSARRSGRTLSSSIFSSSKGPTKKQGFEVGEEPTSPKVTCIGQVRSKSKHDKKNKASSSATRKGVHQQSGREEGKKESACSSFAKDFSCFGMPCDSYGSLPSFRGDKKSNGTVFAKSLVLIQKGDDGKTMAADMPKTQFRAQSCAGEENRGGDLPVRSTWEEENQREILSIVTASPVIPRTDVISKTALITEDPTSSVEEDYDTFEAEPPPTNALLLMRNKVEHLHVVVPPPSINITLKRSTSAPAHCRRKSEEKNECSQDDGKSAMEAQREMSSVLISSEDLPKPIAASKSFLQRCKSVSRSLSRSSSELAEEAKSFPAQDAKNELKTVHDTQEALEKEELHLVSEALSRRRSDSEALKVSLDIVPETWLWEARAVARQDTKETSGSGRKLDMKPAAEWLDGELEAALWKSCQVAELSISHHRDRGEKDPLPVLPKDADLMANQCLDAEVEATLWRCCSSVASHSAQDLQSETQTGESGEICVATQAVDEKSCRDFTDIDKTDANLASVTANSSRNASYLGRSSSVGSQGGMYLLERDFSLRRSASVGLDRQQIRQEERNKIDKMISADQTTEGNAESPRKVSSEGEARHSQSNVGGVLDMDDVKPVTSEKTTVRYIAEAELGGHATTEVAESMEQQINEKHEQAPTEVMTAEDNTSAGPSPSSVLEWPAPPPSPTPATPPEAVLFLRYDLGAAFRISLDASAAKMEVSTDQQHQQQQKAVLEAISHLHIHDVQRTYTHLLKAASGKERASLSSAAFRLQRCKSEPVRLASY